MRQLEIPAGLEKGFAVEARSEQEAEELLEALEEAGFNWMGGESLSSHTLYNPREGYAFIYYITTRGGHFVQYEICRKDAGISDHGFDLLDYDEIMRETDSEEPDESVLAAAFEDILKI